MAGASQNDYFGGFANFEEDPAAPLEEEFARLAISRGWKEDSKRYQKQKKLCLVAQYHVHIGNADVGGQQEKLSKLQKLCQELRVSPVPASITQCKKALKKVHVNIVDLIDSRRRGTRVRIFPSYRALQNNMKQSKRFFPKDEAKEQEGGLLTVLLRRIV